MIVSAGLYFGLRERPRAAEPAPSPPPIATSTTSATGGSTGSSTSVEGPSPASTPAASASASTAAVDAEIKKAMAELGRVAVERCYTPHKSEPGMPKKIHLIYSGAFDANGHELGRGLSETREGAYPPFSKCVRELPMDLRIAPPGRVVTVEVPLDLP
jgi:hypothetical protein